MDICSYKSGNLSAFVDVWTVMPPSGPAAACAHVRGHSFGAVSPPHPLDMRDTGFANLFADGFLSF